MAKTLVTGATGHIGSMVVRELVNRGHRTVALVRHHSDRRGLEDVDVELVEGDVLDRASVDRAAAGTEIVIHCAANFAIWAKNESEILKPALEGTRNVLQAAARAGTRRVVHTSSAAAVGAAPSADRLLNEDDWFDDPRVPYYQAKTRSERLARKVASELELDLVTVCPTMVLGGNDYRLTPSQRVILDLVRGTGATVGGGTNIVSVEDVALGHVLAAEIGKPGARYLLGGDNISIVELGGLVEAITGVRPRHLDLPKWAFKGIAAFMEIGASLSRKPPHLTRAAVDDVLGKYAWYDLSRSQAQLGLESSPALHVVAEAIEWFGKMGWIDPKAPIRDAARVPEAA